MSRGPAGVADRVTATATGAAFRDDFPTQPIDFPTQPIAVGRSQVEPVLDHRHRRAPDATSRRMPPAHRQPPPSRHRRAPARKAARPARSTILIVAAVAIAAITGALGHPSWAAWFPSATPPTGARSAPATSPATPDRQADAVPPRPPPPGSGEWHGDGSGALGEADGAVPDGATLSDDDLPAVSNLDPGLLQALRKAAAAAGDDGVEFVVNSGWRSREYQEHLLDEAISKYGSKKEAARWVATPDTSPHVSGDAIDIGPAAATAWLSRHGADYGLCQIYRNEPWHYELRPDAPDDGCPRMYADPTHDPRMQQ